VSRLLVEDLLGTVVHDANGERIGHLEEIIAEREHDGLTVVEYHVGELALLERLSAVSLLGTFAAWLIPGSHSGVKVPWESMDLSDPEHPRTTVARKELHQLRR
jgi:hypothetical protein